MNRAFADWLYHVKGSGGAATGWAHSIRELADRSNCDTAELFTGLVREFLAEWSPTSPPAR